ncbi:MAG: VIT1/CCC1 transporter family protein [Candidatus Dormibacteria bacterium]
MGSRPLPPRDVEQAPAGSRRQRAVALGLERERLARRTGIREVVFGVQDGLLTTLGITTGMATATAGSTIAHSSILIAGLLGAIAGMFSMGTGAYLATSAARALKHQAIHKERAELSANPEEEMSEMVTILATRGVPQEEARRISAELARHPQLWEETHIEKELGISTDLRDAPVQDGLLMSGTFLLGAILPILPYIFLVGVPAVAAALAVSAVALAAVGVLKAAVTGERLWLGGAQVLLVGGGAAIAGYLVGIVLPRAFGLHLPATT